MVKTSNTSKIYEFTKIFKQNSLTSFWRILDIQLIIQKTDKNPMFIQLFPYKLEKEPKT